MQDMTADVSTGVSEVCKQQEQVHANHTVASEKLAQAVAAVIVRRPCQMMSGCCAVIWIIVIGSVVGSGASMFSEEGPKDWVVLSHPVVEDHDAINLAAGEADCLQAPACEQPGERSQEDSAIIGMNLMYESPADGTGIFTPERLQRICCVERLFTQLPQYKDVCVLGPNASKVRASGGDFVASRDCLPQPLSVVEFFYSGYDPWACELLPLSVVEARRASIYNGLSNLTTFTQSGFFVGSDVVSSMTYTGAQTQRTRSLLRLGYPLYPK